MPSFREGAGWRSDWFLHYPSEFPARSAVRHCKSVRLLLYAVREAALYDTVSLPEIHPRTRALRGFAPTRSKIELPSLMLTVGNDLSQRS